MTPYQREIADYLRDEYGATDVHLQGGGKHPRLCFRYLGAEQHVTIAQTPSDANAAVVKKGDVRRLLGSPPERPEKPRRKLEDMMPEPLSMRPALTVEPLNPAVRPEHVSHLAAVGVGPEPQTYPGTLARYRDRWRLSVPTEVWRRFRSQPMSLQILKAGGGWLLRPTTHGRAPKISDSRKANSTIEHMIDFATPRVNEGTYAATPAEFTVRGDDVYIRLIEAVRPLLRTAPTGPRKKRVSDVKVDAPPSAIEFPEPTRIGTQATGQVHDTATLRSLLEQVRAVEAATPYRLTRLRDNKDGTERLAWSAPRIE